MGIISFFKKIRTENDSVRRRWLISLTSASSFLVIMLWVFYANSFIPSISQYDDKYKPKEVAGAEASREFGVLETFSAGVGYVFKDAGKLTNKVASVVGSSFAIARNKFGKGINEMGSVFNSLKKDSNVIRIDKNSENFVLEGLDPLPKRNLP